MENIENKNAINLASKTNYTNKVISYLRNVSITEWDIYHAGFSVLKYKKLVPEKELLYLQSLPKEKKVIKEGLLQKRNPKIAEEIITTLETVRKAFVLQNNISDREILSIKKDAIFLINKNPEVSLILEEFLFRKKETYTSFFQTAGKEFYYSAYTDTLDIKGLSKESQELQKEFLLKDIKTLIRSAERLHPEMLLNILASYRLKYINRQLPIETYRELDTGAFRYNNFLIKEISNRELEDIDITQNYMNYILPLIQSLL